MHDRMSRRRFVGQAACAAALASWLPCAEETSRASAAEPADARVGDIPLVDYHVHRDNTTLEKLLAISAHRKTKFGIVEHAGTKENQYPIVLSSDAELKAYIASLEGKPVLKGIQAEWIDWPTVFSDEAIAQLDYVLTDAMTVRGDDGKPVKMWTPGFEVKNKQAFMDRYVEFHVEIMATEPIDILANTTYLPPCIEKEYDALWTERRMRSLADAALKYSVALEISSSYCLPRLPQLRVAKEAGVRFSFGSNIRGPNVGKLDYCVETARALGLSQANMFTPAPPGQKPVQRRRRAG